MNPDIGTLDVEIMINPKRHQHPRRRRNHGRDSPGAIHIPRITRLMALAIKFQGMVNRGEVGDYAELARLGYVSRARVTQIMNLLLLAPDIQEAILRLPEDSGLREVNEHSLRHVARLVCWSDQRRYCASNVSS